MVGVRVLGCDEILSWISHLDFNATIIINIKNIALPHDKSDYMFFYGYQTPRRSGAFIYKVFDMILRCEIVKLNSFRFVFYHCCCFLCCQNDIYIIDLCMQLNIFFCSMLCFCFYMLVIFCCRWMEWNAISVHEEFFFWVELSDVQLLWMLGILVWSGVVAKNLLFILLFCTQVLWALL